MVHLFEASIGKVFIHKDPEGEWFIRIKYNEKSSRDHKKYLMTPEENRRAWRYLKHFERKYKYIIDEWGDFQWGLYHSQRL